MGMYSKSGLVLLTMLFLTACSSTGSQQVYSPGTAAAESSRQQVSAEQNAQQLENERQAEAQRQAEAEEAERLAAQRREAARQAQLAEQREIEEGIRALEATREAERRQREQAASRAAEQARIVAAQQARIDELRSRITATDAETENLEAANAVLRQAVAAAEQLTDALEGEEQKYENTDPVSGEPREALAQARLKALAEEVESLSSQAEALMSRP